MLNTDELRRQIRELQDKESVGGMPAAIDFAIAAFPDESWTIERTAGLKRYTATIGGRAHVPITAAGDTPEKALTLAVLYMQLNDRETE